MSDYIKMRGYKYEAPRGAEYRCEHGVMKSGMFDPPHVVSCGKEAVAVWDFSGSGDGDPMPVCEEHDDDIADNLMNLNGWEDMRQEI